MQGRDILLIITIMVIWGVNFVAIKMGASEFDPFVITALRFFFAAFPLVFFIQRPQVPKRYFIAYGTIFGTGVWGMAACSNSFGLSAGITSILMQFDVLTSVLVGALIYKEKITKQMAVGMVIAMVGLTVSIAYTNGNITPVGLIFIFIASLCWPLASIVIRQSGSTTPFAFTIWGMVFAPIPLLMLSLLMNGTEGIVTTFSHWNSHAWFSVLFQAYPTTVFGYWVWNKMTLKYPMALIAPTTLMTTVFGLIGGYVIYDEHLTQVQWVSCALFLAGIVVVVYPRKIRNTVSVSRSVSTES
ncbi:EamA family transporter [Vibrio sp. CAIM 722]|uniref:EamA family transporter n=1 Tax=Vibrio eleionomae TaxID=2653505 RepID=A0A7X4LP62_9VIBR|nr:EamA family transporter [Vibrio eleionomae]MZI95564.1 EamA family transporter [Vibrio eleionomae]